MDYQGTRKFGFAAPPRHLPELDPGFRPIQTANISFINEAMSSGDAEKVKIAVVRNDGRISTYKTVVFGEKCGRQQDNIIYTERLVKALLWLKGGWKVIFGGPGYIGKFLETACKKGGIREFDAEFMGNLYNEVFTVITCPFDDVPDENEISKPIGKHLDGYRIGFDAGGSDRKVSAVIDGRAVYSEEVVWHPKINSDPAYHYAGIMDSIKRAASKMPRVDAIGVSAAGIYINNQVRAASLFYKIPKPAFEEKVKNIFLNISRELGGVPIEVMNDGEVTALAGAMDLNSNRVLGIAMGTSEAAGYVDAKGNITGWLNELAFVPVDYNVNAAQDEWSGDIGCGTKYFSQDGVIKLAEYAGIELDCSLSPAEKLKAVQILMEKDDERAKRVFINIGYYLGYSLAYYSEFYDIEHVLLLGRVTSGKGGKLIMDNAKLVLEDEFPLLSRQINITMPDEKNRRVGQSIAAASLPEIKPEREDADGIQ